VIQMSTANQSATAAPMYESILMRDPARLGGRSQPLRDRSDHGVDHVADRDVERQDAAKEQHREESSSIVALFGRAAPLGGLRGCGRVERRVLVR
jgi:hypothetical protein